MAGSGDLNLFFSQIKTESGGDIQMLAPGGNINAGLANPGSFTKSAADLGVLTLNGNNSVGGGTTVAAGTLVVGAAIAVAMRLGNVRLPAWSAPVSAVVVARGEPRSTEPNCSGTTLRS